MKKISLSYVILIIAPLIFGCGGAAKKENKNNTAPGSFSLHVGDDNYFAIDSAKSVITWKGSNSFGAHTGYVHISRGELLIENERLTGGAVEINMNTIEDERHMSNSGLIKHLKDADFFDVTKFPVATITITRIASMNTEEKEITGNLTIKGITQPVTFPAKTEIRDGMVKANARLVIDRTIWGIRYQSGKFYNLLADKTISDAIEFDITIVAKE